MLKINMNCVLLASAQDYGLLRPSFLHSRNWKKSPHHRQMAH